MGYSFQLGARVLLYASSHRQDNIYHEVCYTSRGAQAETRYSSMGPPWRNDPTTHRTTSERCYHGATSRSLSLYEQRTWQEPHTVLFDHVGVHDLATHGCESHQGSIWRPITQRANALTTELPLAHYHCMNNVPDRSRTQFCLTMSGFMTWLHTAANRTNDPIRSACRVGIEPNNDLPSPRRFCSENQSKKKGWHVKETWSTFENNRRKVVRITRWLSTSRWLRTVLCFKIKKNIIYEITALSILKKNVSLAVKTKKKAIC